MSRYQVELQVVVEADDEDDAIRLATGPLHTAGMDVWTYDECAQLRADLEDAPAIDCSYCGMEHTADHCPDLDAKLEREA